MACKTCDLPDIQADNVTTYCRYNSDIPDIPTVNHPILAIPGHQIRQVMEGSEVLRFQSRGCDHQQIASATSYRFYSAHEDLVRGGLQVPFSWDPVKETSIIA